MADQEWELMAPVADNGALVRAEIDIQIATAHKYPRDLKRSIKTAKDMATSSVEIAEDCRYMKPVGKDRNGVMQYADGPSVRLAEIMSCTWGNLRVGTRLVAVEEKRVIVQGVCHDLESNLAVTADVTSSIWGKYGRYKDSMIEVTIAAASSIARRNAILQVVPRSIVNEIAELAKEKALGSTNNLASKTGKILSRLANSFGVDLDRVLATLNLESASDIKQDHLDSLIKLGTAIKEGHLSVEDAFPPLIPEAPVKHAKAKAEDDDIDFDSATGEVID